MSIIAAHFEYRYAMFDKGADALRVVGKEDGTELRGALITNSANSD